MCEQKKNILCSKFSNCFGFVHCSGTKKTHTHKRTFNLFPSNRWKTSSLHIIVKFGVKIDLFSDISLFYRITAFIVFVQIWNLFFNLFISIRSSNCQSPLCCLLNFDNCLKHAYLSCSTPWIILIRFLLKSTKYRLSTAHTASECFPQSRSKVVLIALILFGWQDKFYNCGLFFISGSDAL